MPETSKPAKKKAHLDEKLDELDTGETCQEHIRAMKKEMAKRKNKNLTLIKELMGLTFPSRRKQIVHNPATLNVILRIIQHWK